MPGGGAGGVGSVRRCDFLEPNWPKMLIWQALVALYFVKDSGFGPMADLLSFASPKESKQRKSDPATCIPSLRYGQPAVLDLDTGGRTHCAPASLRSNSCRQSDNAARQSFGWRAVSSSALLGAGRRDWRQQSQNS